MEPKLRMLLAAGLLISIGLSGCASHRGGAGATTQMVDSRESEMLSGVTQLTSGDQFERAGEAYFSADMKWVVFQGVPKGEQNYQMYLAKLVGLDEGRTKLEGLVQITPPGSKNTCGWFSNDGKTLIFASTAGKEDPEEAAPGYQRQGRNYRWAFSKGMEIYKVEGWQEKLTTKAVNWATPENRITNNDYYDAECVLSKGGHWMIFCSDRPAGALPSQATTPGGRPKNLFAQSLSNPNQIVQLTDTAGYNGGPMVSPDGKRLVYRSDRVGNDLLQIYVADLKYDPPGNNIVGLENERAVTSDANVNWGPYWLPDGQSVIYATSKVTHTNYELFMRKVDGTGEQRVTYSAGPDVLPVVGKDGKGRQWLMWASRRGADQTTQVYLARFTPGKGG